MLHVESYGEAAGEPVLAVHGITGFGARFGRLAGLLPHRRWLCPDLRGHGRSTTEPPWGTEAHVADLVEVLDAHSVERADLVGHSFGGHLALHLLAAAPERIGRVVLLDPASLADPAHAERRASELACEEPWPSEADARAEIGSWFATEGAAPDHDLELERNLVRLDDGRCRMRFSPMVVATAYSEMCRPLPGLPADHEVLLVEADPEHTSVNERLRHALNAALGDGLTRVVIEGGTHVVFRTHLEETAAALRPVLT